MSAPASTKIKCPNCNGNHFAPCRELFLSINGVSEGLTDYACIRCSCIITAHEIAQLSLSAYGLNVKHKEPLHVELQGG